MDLNILWFILIAVLYLGFFLLEGFDYGVGMLLPFLGKKDEERRIILNTIGPFWDGNEVWLLTAGGATFAAFPHWYATLFSGFYLALFLLLLALIGRGVAFEFRSKLPDPRWRATWDWVIFAGSLLPALLLGVAFANIVKGVPIDANKQFVGTFFDLLNPYALLGGIAAVSGFALYGATFLALRTTGEVMARARAFAKQIWVPTVVILILFTIATYLAIDVMQHLGVNPGPIPLGAAAALLVAGWFVFQEREGWAFGMTALAIAFTVITIFLLLFPDVLPSTLNPAWNLTIYNASSTPYTLMVMTIVAVIFVPIVLLYQGWTYWVFRHRIDGKPLSLKY